METAPSQLIGLLRNLLDRERKTYSRPETLCTFAVFCWAAICGAGYLSLLSIRNGIPSGASGSALDAVNSLLSAWWPFIWALPTLILIAVRFVLKRKE